MPKINVYLPEELAAAVRDAQVPVSAVCQAALERAVREVTSARASDAVPHPTEAGFGLFGRFTQRARQALKLAEDIARDAPDDHVGTAHILLGLLDEGGNLAIKVLASLDIELDDLRTELRGSMPHKDRRCEGHLPFEPLAKKALETTAKEAMGMFHNYIGCEHLLLGLLATEEGLASQVMRRMGVELRTTRRTVATVLAGVVHAKAQPAPAAAPVVAAAATEQSAPEAALQEILRRLEAIERRLPDAPA